MPRGSENLSFSRIEQSSSRFNEKEIAELNEALTHYATEEAPQISEFADVRPEMEIERDEKEVERLLALFDTRDKDKGSEKFEHLGKALELVLMDFAGSWLPGYISKASEYDDILNKTDLVLEMQNDNDRILRLALDVTANSPKTSQKIWEIVKELRMGRLSRLKYFKSQLDDTRDIKYVPRVVVGSDNLDQTRQLIRLYLSYQRNEDPLQRNRVRKAIAQHPIGRDILDQIIFQLRRTSSILQSSTTSHNDRDQKVGYVEAAISELEGYKKENAAPDESDTESSQDRNGVLQTIRQAFSTA